MGGRYPTVTGNPDNGGMTPSIEWQESSADGAQPSLEALLTALDASTDGLTSEAVSARLARYGPNALPPPKPVTWWMLVFRQLRNPFAAILAVALVLSWLLHDAPDAAFIGVVILLDVLVGVVQEWGAERSAAALRALTDPASLTIRDGVARQIPARELVPGDIVLVESGVRVPADLRLLEAFELWLDESSLTGESLPVAKGAVTESVPPGPIAEATHSLFAGTLVTAGRARGLVVATGSQTALGQLAASLQAASDDVPPLVQRMRRFAGQVAYGVLGLTLLLVGVELARGKALADVALYAIALAVSAIPEGLPVAITITLAVAVHRLSRREVIVRRLVAVESLGSCTYIATDKTGTLTENQLTIRRIMLPDLPARRPEELEPAALIPLAEAGMSCNEATRIRNPRDGTWLESGDAVDLAFLRLGAVLGIDASDARSLRRLPYESTRQGAAVWIATESNVRIYAKGAPEAILPRCVQGESWQGRVSELATKGYKVLAVAAGTGAVLPDQPTGLPDGLELLGLVGLQDPIRSEVPGAIAQCQSAGITVAMVTGDHPATAWAISQELGLATAAEALVTGPELAQATEAERAALIQRGRVFARVDPLQKLQIVQTLMDRGEAVAVTGDGANDAPALRAAHVGVAMGQRGTDIARESSELILTDDNFASLVNGIEEGRVAYSNIRKVVHLLVSTSVAEIVLVVSALLTGLPVPLTAVQLLWLNLVAEGIQDVGLAFEPAEGDELRQRPRPLREPLFNRLMIQRVVVSGIVMGGVSWWLFQSLVAGGASIEAARNQTLLLMVLFENIQVGVCRSELRSAFALNPLRSPILLWGTLAATSLHIGAMHWPVLQRVLDVAPVSPDRWALLLALSLTILVASEIHKWVLRHSKLIA